MERVSIETIASMVGLLFRLRMIDECRTVGGIKIGSGN
jgi:hypothetical protein